jgi:hypothetical protein
VTDCDASGSVTASSSFYSRAGGVIGYLYTGTTTNNTYAANTGQAHGIEYDVRESGATDTQTPSGTSGADRAPGGPACVIE